MEASILLQLILNGLMLGATYGLVVAGLAVVFSIMRIVNFAHGELYMLGGFIAYYFCGQWGINFGLTLLIAALLVGLLGVVLERLIFRPFRFDIVGGFVISFGLVLVFQELAMLGFGIMDRSFPSVFTGELSLGGIFFATERVAIVFISIALLLGLNLFLQRHKTGQAMRAVAQDIGAAILNGVKINQISAVAFGLSGALAGVAGALLGPVFIINPWIGGGVILKAFVMIIVGGMGSIPGAIIASFAFGLIESFGGFFFGQSVVAVIFFGVLILVLLVRPTGIMGHG